MHDDTRDPPRRSLRNRVAITLAVFGGLVSLSLAVGVYLVSHNLESQLLDDTLKAEIDDLVERQQRNPGSIPEHTATIRAYVIERQARSGDIPAAVSTLLPGQHQLVLQGKTYRSAVSESHDRRFVVLYDMSALQRRERGFVLLLAGSVALITVVTALSGRWLASRMIAPVTELVKRAARLQPGEPHPRLAGEFPWVEVQKLAADFDSYLERLEAFIERERLFTGDVSHELRTPLSVIAGASELLLADDSLPPKTRERVARIGRAVAEMSEMTGALLALAREQDRPSEQAPTCAVAEVAHELVERQRELLRSKPLSLSLEIDATPRLAADKAVLSMVFGNLLRNALNFTSEGEVRVRVTQHALEVRDTGSGIGDQDVTQLFRPYVRSANSPGSGLGLSLVQRLCERQGWRVDL